jgi:hypothetical protein
MNALAYSIVTASVAGLLAGFAMKPGNALADRPIGPQILISGASNRVINEDGWYAQARLASYNGQTPEYVLGTDWTQPPAYDVAYAEETAPAEAVQETVADEPGDFAAPVKVSAPPAVAETPRYPSEDGDILAGLGDHGPKAIEVSATADDAVTS